MLWNRKTVYIIKNRIIKKGKKIKCKICKGTGHITALKRQEHFNDPGYIQPPNKWPDNYKIPGPRSRGLDNRNELLPRNGEVLSNICGDWKIYQRKAGHRYTTDDLCTAYIAFQSIEKYNIDLKYSLDIGCGLGTVLLFTAFQYPNIQCRGIEAQEISYDLAKRTLLFNGIENRCKIYNGDLRNFIMDKDDIQKFQLITGTPPYFIVKKGTVLPAKVDQKACLCEFRGGVEDYCMAAKRFLDKGGIFVVVGTAYRIDRFENGSKNAKLKIIERWDFIGKEGKPPLFTVCVMKHEDEVDNDKYETHTMIIRDKDCNRTKEYRKLMDKLGFPPDYK